MPKLEGTVLFIYLNAPYDYFISTSRYNQDLTSYPKAKVIYSVERAGAVLAVIKQLSP